jgi:hypothetical protein
MMLHNQPQIIMAKPTTKDAAARIQSAVAKRNDGQTPKDSFAARAQSTADRKQTR